MTASTLRGDFSNLQTGPAALISRRHTLGLLERARLKAILAEAERLGITGSVSEALRDPRLVARLARRFQIPVPSLDACRRYYAEHEAAFRAPDRYLGRQIVLRCPPTDITARTEAWARAERLVAILFFDPKMFTDLLATYDSLSGAGSSGRIGPVAPGVLPPVMENALFGLRPGQICPAPVATEAGIHVVILDRILPGELRPFASVHGRISAHLRQEARTAAARRHLARLAKHYLAAVAE